MSEMVGDQRLGFVRSLGSSHIITGACCSFVVRVVERIVVRPCLVDLSIWLLSRCTLHTAKGCRMGEVDCYCCCFARCWAVACHEEQGVTQQRFLVPNTVGSTASYHMAAHVAGGPREVKAFGCNIAGLSPNLFFKFRVRVYCLFIILPLLFSLSISQPLRWRWSMLVVDQSLHDPKKGELSRRESCPHPVNAR